MMANVLQPNNGFHPRPVSHAPSPFGFGFGLSSASTSIASPWSPGHTNPSAFQQLASSMTQSSKSQKRKVDHDDDSEKAKHPNVRDESMDRSPTPERLKRGPPKKARVANAQNATNKADTKAGRSSDEEEDNVDIGVLLGKFDIAYIRQVAHADPLAGLPPQSLLPILSGILKMQPSLKKVILPLIPRPSLEDAVEALKQAAKKLHDAMPFSNVPSSTLHYTFGMPQQQPTMRNDYVLGRLRPYIAEFASTCLSYFPYFSYKPTADSSGKNNSSSSSQRIATIQKEKFQPAEAFAFLNNVTKLIIEQPALIIPELEPLVLPKLTEEWKNWVDNLDRHANREGNMVSPSVARTWEIEIERLRDGKAPGISRLMRDVEKHFPVKQGWAIPSMII